MAHPTRQEIPCALSHHVSKTQKKVDALSLVERQLAFQHWVAYERKRTLDMSSKQRFECPLSSCTTSHADFESLLNHVAVCPRLGAAHYWCSECGQEEHFPTGFDSPFASRQSALKRIGSRVKGAVLFFKHLSFRGHGSRMGFGKESPIRFELGVEGQCTTEPFEKKVFKAGESETKFFSPDCLSLLGPSHEVQTYFIDAEHEEMTYMKPSELPGTRVRPRELPKSFIGAKLVDLKGNDALDSLNDCDLDSINSTELVSPGISQATCERSPMSPTTHIFTPLSSPAKMTGGDEVECEDPVTEFSDIPSSCCEISELMAGQEPLEPMPSGSIRAMHPSTGPRTSSAAPETLALRDRIEELHHVLQTLWSECLGRLSRDTDILLRVTGPSPNGLLEQGLQVLQDAIVGKPPRSFQHILSLVLFALACAYVLHEDCNVHYWNGLLQNMTEWRYMIADIDDRKMFVRVVARLAMQTQEIRKPCHARNILSITDESSSAPHRMKPCHQQAEDAAALGQAQVIEVSLSASRDLDDVLEALKKEMLFTTCLEFLDDVAYAEILERSCIYQMTAPEYVKQHAENIEDMSSSIIWKLKERPEMEIITTGINDALNGIVIGLLRNPREVEVTLLSHCMKACRDMPMHKDCRQIIYSVCDRPVIEEGPDWHARHHAATLYNLMAVCRESMEAVILSPLLGYEEVSTCTSKSNATRYEPYPTPSPSSDASTLTLVNPSSSFAAPASPSALIEDTDGTILSEGSVVKNLTEGTLSASPRSQPSFSSKDSKIQCAQCSGVFLKTNLSRHVHTVHQPQHEPIVCAELFCTSSFTRYDNFEKHMRKKHSEVTTRSQRVSKRRKVSQAESLPEFLSTDDYVVPRTLEPQ